MADYADKKPTAADLEEVHTQAMKRADEAWTFERDNVTKGREDQRFYIGGLEQWDPAAQQARGTSRPMLTVNRMPAFVRQLTGTIRRETPAVKVLPTNGGTKEVAEILGGLIRNIEVKSDADYCYAKAAENAAKASQGSFRIVTEYSSDKGFEQEIRIRPIADPFGVLIDPLATLPDKSDMAYGFVYEHISKEAFKAKYPGKEPDDIPLNAASGIGTGFAWRKGDSVTIAEYWTKKPAGKVTLYLLEDGTVVDKKPAGAEALRTREVERQKVCSYIVSGKEILSGPHEWPSKYIPICVVAGEEDTIDGATVRKGMIRDAKDPQKILNYARSTEAETIALQPKAPYVLTNTQIAGYESQWNQAGSANLPYLLYKPDPLSPGPPQRAQPPRMSDGLASLSLTAGQDIKDVTGIFDASLGNKSNETSGRAIMARQKEGDTGTYLYVDNLRRAIRYGAAIIIDLIPHVYDTERVVRVLKEDKSHEEVTVNQQVQDPLTGVTKVLNDLSVGEYDVVVSTGPDFLTQREEKREALIGLVQAAPGIAEQAADLLVDAIDYPGGDTLVKRLRQKMGLDEEGEPLPQQAPQPDPAMVAKALKDAAGADLTKAQAEGQEIENATMLMQLSQVGQMLQQLQPVLQQVLALNDGGGQPGAQSAQQDPSTAPPPGPQGMNLPPQLGPSAQNAMNVSPTNGAAPMMNGEASLAELEPIDLEGAPV